MVSFDVTLPLYLPSVSSPTMITQLQAKEKSSSLTEYK